MARITSFHVAYDPDSDVLYISTEKQAASRGIEDEYGFVWRYDGEGNLIGLTVTDFRDFWLAKKDLLADQMSSHFAITPNHANVVLDRAMPVGRAQ